MALLSSFTKQPREILDFDIDYTTVLSGRSDTIASKVVEVSPAGLTIVSSTLSGGNKIKVVVSLGTTAVTYKVTVLATTTAGLVYEDEVNVLVEEV